MASARSTGWAEFISTVSHELKTPLTSIIAFTDILAKNQGGEKKDRNIDQLDIVKKSGQHLLTLINDLLDYSRLESGEVKIEREEFVVSDRLDENQIKEVTEDEIVAIRVKELSSLVETYLLKGGVIDTTSVDEDVDLDEEINALPLHEVRDFITTYNKYFMTNYKAEEFIISEEELNEKVAAGAGIGGGEVKPKKPGTFLKYAKKVAKGILKFAEPAVNLIKGKGYKFDD